MRELPESDPPAPTEPSLAEKVAALSRPDCYPSPVHVVQAIETHMSWVFLTDTEAWQLKKPVRYEQLDFRSLAARQFYCLEELRLNRRLAPGVYLDVVALAPNADGALRIGGGLPAIDWLVRMRRLSSELLLDALLARGAAKPAHMEAIAARLAQFHRDQPAAPIGSDAYRALLLRHVDAYERELCLPAWELPIARLRALFAAQRAFLQQRAALFDARVVAGCVIEAHGDLRPEHVWVGAPLAIIDALEFSAELRLQDGADEVGFLALECERAHAAWLARVLLRAYAAAGGDLPPPLLVHFYQSCRACQRARLAIWHLHEARYRGSPRWRRRALRYLVLAERHLAQALTNEGNNLAAIEGSHAAQSAVPQRLQHGDALLVVDVQNDFLPGGALAVPACDAVVAPLNRWIARFAASGLPIYASRDWHPADHCSFVCQGGSWPSHCVAGTSGAEFAPGLQLPPHATTVSKGHCRDVEAYSAFSGTELGQTLRAHDVRRLFVGGLATDYCVLATVRDALQAGLEVTVLTDAIRPVEVHPGDGAAALAAMRAVGAKLLTDH